MRMKDLGEFKFIDRISKRIRNDRSVFKGIGDDAAVIRKKGGGYLLFSSDMMVEGVHFNKRRATPSQIGYKALSVNISDIAAMGGIPKYAVISIGVPKGLDIRFADGIYGGVIAAAKRFGVNIVGGDTVSSKGIVIDVAVIGEAAKDELVLRSGAKAGDIIAVTGTLGGSIRGKHLNFTPRLKESRFLVKNFKINSMIDISDGLAGDILHICRASKVGARLYESLIPVAKKAGSLKDALYSGEDFEILFTAPRRNYKDLEKGFKKRLKTPLSAIGEIVKVKDGVKIVDRLGRASRITGSGFRHF
ncbi:MAG: thiamine-phosphate kinase [Candidatus Omnitrophica bacterium]|nr:thiamine-phosphate kinase [Candidatus Omnitrophota bacterium]